MQRNDEEQRAERLARSFLTGNISRRSFMARAAGFSTLALSATSLGAVLAACSNGTTTSSGSVAAPATGAPTAGGTLQAALTGEPDTIDPATSTIYTGAQVYDNIFNKLVDLDASNKFYGQLATAWNAPDDKTWVFDLVDTATFHNGEKFGPNDVVYTFERILDPKTASSYAPLYNAIDKVEATGPTQVTFHLKTPFGPFLSNLANNGEIVNQKAIESKDPSRNAIGTGPFEFVEWVQGDHITLKKNDSYFLSGKPYLDGITFKFLNVDQSRVDALRSGDLNWSDAVPLQQLNTLKNDPAFNYVTSATAGIPDYIAMNTKQAPFDDKLVRQAVYWALDRDAIRQVAYFGAGESGIEEVPTGSSWYDGSPLITPDVEKAKSLLQQAGVTTPLEVEYLGLPQYPELLKTGEVMQQQLEAVGIKMNIKQVEVGVWFNAFIKGDYQITSAYQERTIDPDNFYALVIHSGGDINTTGYANPQADQLIDQARTETDEQTRFDLYKQLRQIVFDDSPIIFAHYETINYLMQKNVVGSTVNPTLELRMQDVGFMTPS
jgi:peptide/nickel transport system substrate-binding protein